MINCFTPNEEAVTRLNRITEHYEWVVSYFSAEIADVDTYPSLTKMLDDMLSEISPLKTQHEKFMGDNCDNLEMLEGI